MIEEVTQINTGLWADVACVALDRGVRFLLMGDFRQLPAVLDSFAGARVERPLKDSDLLQDLGGRLLPRAARTSASSSSSAGFGLGKPRRCLWPRP